MCFWFSTTVEVNVTSMGHNLICRCTLEWALNCFPYVIDLFSLYILFFHFRPRDATRGNSFFQMSSYARANLRITNEKTKGQFP